MKIFNWIHRHRFPHNVQPSEISLIEDGSSVRRSGSSIRKGGVEKEPLLEEDVKAIEDWELDGILTIGTLAINPFETINLEDHDTGDDGEAEMLFGDNDHCDDNKIDTILLKDDSKCEIEMCKFYVHKLRDVVKGCNTEIEEVVEEEIMYENLTSLGKRVTLLDLFLADKLHGKVAEKESLADDYVDVEDDDDDENKVIKKKKKLILYSKLPAALGGKKGFLSKSKKNDGDIRPLKKLQRFMTKMMKRKIHPDMEARLQKKGQGRLNDDVSMEIDGRDSTNEQYAANEFVSLLPFQGIVV